MKTLAVNDKAVKEQTEINKSSYSFYSLDKMYCNIYKKKLFQNLMTINVLFAKKVSQKRKLNIN